MSHYHFLLDDSSHTEKIFPEIIEACENSRKKIAELNPNNVFSIT